MSGSAGVDSTTVVLWDEKGNDEKGNGQETS